MDKGVDEEFKSTMAEMKPHAKKLPQKSSERHRVTQWIKKLLGVKYEKKQRNAHAKLLLQQLKYGKLGLPFTDDPPQGLLQMLSLSSPSPLDQTNELDSLFTAALSSSDAPLPTSTLKPKTGSTSRYQSASKESDDSVLFPRNHLEQRQLHLSSKKQRSYGDLSGKSHVYTSSQRGPRYNGNTVSFESRLHTSADKSTASRPKSHTPSVHYDDKVVCQHDHSSVDPSKVSSHDRIPQTNLPNGIGRSSSNGYKSTCHYSSAAATSPSHKHRGGHGRRRQRLTSTKRSDNSRMGRGFAVGAKEDLGDDDSDLLTVGDLDLSPLTLSDESVGGASYDELLDDEDGELSDVSELLLMSPRHRVKPMSSCARGSDSAHVSSLSPYRSRTNPMSENSAPLPGTPSHSPLKTDISREIIQARKVESKLRSAEARFEEEKLMIQKTQEESIKKLLDRKNNELEDLRSEHHLKVAQLEAQNQRLERKVAQMERENTHLHEVREMEVADSRNSSQQLRQQLQADFDNKLNTAITEFEREKLELEQYRSKQLQRVVKENSTRMAKMEEEHNTQTRNNKDIISELEGRIKDLSRDLESLSETNSRLTRDKVALEQKSSSLENQLAQSQNSVWTLEEELSAVREERDSQVKQLRSKMEQNAKSLQHQYSIQEAKLKEQLTELQHQLSSSREETEALKTGHRQHVIELEANFQQQWKEKDLDHERKLVALRTELKQVESAAEEKQLRLEVLLRETKEQLEKTREQLSKAKASQELQARQAENTIEDFKAQVEQQTSAMFEEMQNQLSQLESELSHSKAKREREAREFAREKKEEKHQVEMEREALKQQHEEEVAGLVRDHQREMEAVVKDLEEERESAVAKLTSALKEASAQAKAKAAHSAKIVSSFEKEVKELREQVEEEREDHRLAVREIREKAEDEKKGYLRIHESAISKLKSQLEKQRAHLKEEHKMEIKDLIDKHDHRVQELEHGFSLKTAQHNETVSGLQTQLDLIQEELESQQKSHEQQLSDFVSRTEEERASMKQHHQTVLKGLQQDIEAAHSTISQLEERGRRQRADHESKVSRMRLQHENTLKGMMPSSVKQEYEETIKSLRSQVSILTQRASLLQDELDRSYTTPSPSHQQTSSRGQHTIQPHTSQSVTVHSPHKLTTLTLSNR